MEPSLKISSYNCQGIKSHYDYLEETFKECNILFAQETWMCKCDGAKIREIQ